MISSMKYMTFKCSGPEKRRSIRKCAKKFQVSKSQLARMLNDPTLKFVGSGNKTDTLKQVKMYINIHNIRRQRLLVPSPG